MKKPKGKDQRILASESGARSHEELVGDYEANDGLRVMLMQNQESGSGRRIRGAFKLLACGNGPYAELLKPYEGIVAESAGWLIKQVRQSPAGVRCTHILNLNMLTLSEPD